MPRSVRIPISIVYFHCNNNLYGGVGILRTQPNKHIIPFYSTKMRARQQFNLLKSKLNTITTHCWPSQSPYYTLPPKIADKRHTDTISYRHHTNQIGIFELHQTLLSQTAPHLIRETHFTTFFKCINELYLLIYDEEVRIEKHLTNIMFYITGMHISSQC